MMFPETRTTLVGNLPTWNDRRTWDRFSRDYGPVLMRLATRAGLRDAEAVDVVQDALVAVAEASRDERSRYNPSRGKFRAWLRAIVQHKIQDALRRAARRSKHEAAAPAPEAIPPPADDLDALFDREWRLRRMEAGLEELRRRADPFAFQALELRLVRGLPVRDVARALGMTPNHVSVSCSRMKRALRLILSEFGDEEE